MELGTYKFVKQPNQHKGKWLYWIKKQFLHLIKLLGGMTATATLIALIFMAGQYSVPEHISAITTIQKQDFPPILQKICKAESQNKQFKTNGHVTRGKVNPSDIGYCQINEIYWNDIARDMGIDIYTEEGNKEMALYIFNNYGTDPWSSSKKNWSN